MLINLRPFIHEGKERLEILRRLHRFAPGAQFDEGVRAAMAAGLFTEDVRATDKARALAARLTELQRTLMHELWADQRVIDDLHTPLGAVVDSIPSHYPGDAFSLSRAWADLDRPSPPGPFLVHHLLTALRYLRADCHSEILEEAELTPGEASRLDRAWRELEGPHHDHPLENLVLRGLVTEHGEITPDGRSYRHAIEDETNSTAAAVWENLEPDQRAQVLAALESLPDHVAA